MKNTKKTANWMDMIFLLALLTFVFCQSVSGDVHVVGNKTAVLLDGNISKADVNSFNNLLKSKKYFFSAGVVLTSMGGDIDSAIEIGRLIRNSRLSTMVPRPSTCASSCVLVLCAGVRRYALGRIGIHRPYSSSTDTQPETSSTDNYKGMMKRVKEYLEEMAIPDALFDEMMKVPSHHVRWLNYDECEKLGINGSDPATDDIEDSESAAERGISKEEWLRRKRRAEQECRLPDPNEAESFRKYIECTVRIWGPIITKSKK